MAAGETFRDCAVRETIEETGVVPKIIAPLPPVITKYWKGENTYEEKTVYGYFAVQCDESQIPNPLDGENSDVRFFDIDSLPPVHKYQVSLIASAIGVAEDYFVKKS